MRYISSFSAFIDVWAVSVEKNIKGSVTEVFFGLFTERLFEK